MWVIGLKTVKDLVELVKITDVVFFNVRSEVPKEIAIYFVLTQSDCETKGL